MSGGTADPCLGISGCSGAPNLFPIPLDPSLAVNGFTAGSHPVASGNFAMWNGTITSTRVNGVTYGVTGLYTSAKSTQSITVTFTTASGPVVLAWGDHIATRPNWGNTNTILSVNGSSYHTFLLGVDGSGGAQDQQLDTGAVIYPGSITVAKHATPQGSQAFGFTASPAPLTGFSLTDDGTSANTQVFSNITNFTTYTITESSLTGWTRTSISCIDSDSQASVGLQAPQPGSRVSRSGRARTFDAITRTTRFPRLSR